MFDLGPPKLPANYYTIVRHIDALWRLLTKLEKQVLMCESPWWEETLGEIREAWVWLDEEVKDVLANEAWADDKAMEAFYPKEVMEKIYKERAERKRKRGGEVEEA